MHYKSNTLLKKMVESAIVDDPYAKLSIDEIDVYSERKIAEHKEVVSKLKKYRSKGNVFIPLTYPHYWAHHKYFFLL